VGKLLRKNAIIWQNMCWATFWAIFLEESPVTLERVQFSSRKVWLDGP
jgi:hypothetical protein